jgi:uncharacterized protein YjbI with pentapeptide repeats
MSSALEPLTSRLKQIEEVSKSVHNVLYLLLAFSAYIAMTIISLKDGDLVAGATLITLPLIQKNLTATAFYVVAPMVALAMYAFLLLSAHVLLQSVDQLPFKFHDGSSTAEHLHPMILTRAFGSLVLHANPGDTAIEPHIRRSPNWSEPIAICFAALLLWLPVPFVAALAVWRVARIPALSLSIPLFVVFTLSCIVTAVSVRAACVVARPKYLRGCDRLQLMVWIPLLVAACGWISLGHLGYLGPLSMRRHDFAAADLRRFSLRGADLSGANLQSANLSGSDLNGARCRGASFAGADLTEAVLTDGVFDNATFDSANLTNAQSTRGSSFVGASLRKVRINAAQDKTRLNGADFSGSDLTGAHIESADFAGSLFVTTTLDGAFLNDVNLESVNLTGAHLVAARLAGVRLRQANLTAATFDRIEVDRSCDLSGAILVGIRGRGVVMAAVALKGADLHSSILIDANLVGANLRDAKLQNADLRRADLSGPTTNLIGATLIGTKLAGAAMIDIQLLTDAVVTDRWLESLASMDPPPKGLAELARAWRVEPITRYGGTVFVLRKQVLDLGRVQPPPRS